MRRSAGPIISLFSFQDIITSVMGILLFVALLLALQLVQAAVRVHEAPTEPGPSAEEMQRLGKRKAELENELQRLTTNVQDYSQISLESVAALRRRVEDAGKQLRQMEARTEKAFDRGNSKIREDSKKNEELNRQRAQLDRELTQIETELRRLSTMKELTFHVSGFEESNRYVLDFGRDVWKVYRLSRQGDASPVIVWTGSLVTRKSQALRWCEQLNGSDYVFLLVRPSAIQEARDIIERLRIRDIPRGFEPLGEDQQFQLTSSS
ncbi:MAG: hypothetical protein ACUVQK_14505 [Thermogutta sp.]